MKRWITGLIVAGLLIICQKDIVPPQGFYRTWFLDQPVRPGVEGGNGRLAVSGVRGTNDAKVHVLAVDLIKHIAVSPDAVLIGEVFGFLVGPATDGDERGIGGLQSGFGVEMGHFAEADDGDAERV